jgi:small GTP-binding protein
MGMPVYESNTVQFPACQRRFLLGPKAAMWTKVGWWVWEEWMFFDAWEVKLETHALPCKIVHFSLHSFLPFIRRFCSSAFASKGKRPSPAHRLVPNVFARSFAARVPGKRGQKTKKGIQTERPWKPPPKNRRRTKLPMPGESRVLLIGRPNVGKSTLFNRLSGSRAAIVHPVAGTTRDRREARAELAGLFFTIEDTAGLDTSLSKEKILPEDVSEGRVNDLTFSAFADADVILFVCDVQEGVTFMDQHYANIVRKNAGKSPKKPKVFLVANKADSHWAKGYTDELDIALSEFHELGFGDPCPLCAENGDGIAGIFDILKDHVKEVDHEAVAAAAALQLSEVEGAELGDAGGYFQSWEDASDGENDDSDAFDDDDDIDDFVGLTDEEVWMEDLHDDDEFDDQSDDENITGPLGEEGGNSMQQLLEDELVRVPSDGVPVEEEAASSKWHRNTKELPRKFQMAIVGVPNVSPRPPPFPIPSPHTCVLSHDIDI